MEQRIQQTKGEEYSFGLSTTGLKLIAIISMLIDHMGYVLFPNLIFMRAIGRLAFPIFCFTLVEGFFHTRSVPKYMLRLILFALVSEIPFDLAFRGKMYDPEYNNVFFTLAIGLGVMWVTFAAYQKTSSRWYGVLFALGGMLLAEYMNTDYSSFGVAVIFILFLGRWASIGAEQKKTIGIKIGMFLMLCLLFYYHSWPVERVALLSFLLTFFFYSGKKTGILLAGKAEKVIQYAFYLFYPVHLLILAWIAYGRG